MSEKYRKILLISLGVILGLMPLAIFEYALRTRVFYPVKYWRFLQYGFGQSYRVETQNSINVLVPQLGAAGTVFNLIKPAHTYRILVIGESSAWLLADSMAHVLPQTPGVSLEIMNMAVSGGSLEMAERKFAEGIRYSPDLVILLFGHNTFYYHPHPAQYALGKIIGKIPFLHSLLALNNTQNQLAFSPAHRLRTLGNFLLEIADWSHRREVPVVLVTAPGNLWEPPEIRFADLYNKEFLESSYLWDTGKKIEAINCLRHVISNSHQLVPLWYFTLGDWLAQSGDYKEALPNLGLARDKDGSRLRASSGVNDLIRKTALQQNLWLLDADTWIQERAPHGIPGFESFSDDQHLSGSNFNNLSEDLWRLLAYQGWPKPGLIQIKSSAYATTPSVAFASVKRSIYQYGVLRNASDLTSNQAGLEMECALATAELIKREPKLDASKMIRSLNLSSLHQEAMVNVCFARAFWRDNRPSQARSMIEQARRLDPRWDEPALWDGIFSLRAGHDSQAAALFNIALRNNPGRVDAAFFLAKIRN